MNFPAVVHPKRVHSQGGVFEVSAYCKLTDVQALKVVRHYLRSHRITKKDHSKVIRIVTTFNKDSVAML